MKKSFFMLLFIPALIYSQVDISAGLGINLTSKSSLKDYINIQFATPGAEVKSFETEAEFFAEADYSIGEKFDLGVEYAMAVYSYNTGAFFSVYDFSYTQHKPSLLLYYVLKGEGYKFKFGAGAGARYISIIEKLPTTTMEETYTALGFGLLAKAFGMTSLGGNVFAYIGIDARLDLPGEPENNGRKLYNGGLHENLSLNSVSAGFKLGVVYSL